MARLASDFEKTKVGSFCCEIIVCCIGTRKGRGHDAMVPFGPVIRC